MVVVFSLSLEESLDESGYFVALVIDELLVIAGLELLSFLAKPTSLYPTNIASATTAITLTVISAVIMKIFFFLSLLSS